MVRVVGTKPNSILEYECDCGVSCQVEYLPRGHESDIARMSIRHCQNGQRQWVEGKVIATREKRREDWKQVSFRND